MSTKLTDRSVLVRTLQALETANCCSFWACPGPDRKPVPMATCTQASTVWDLRNYMERHGGWCPEHAQNLAACHPPQERERSYSTLHCDTANVSWLCMCRPVLRNVRGTEVPTIEKEAS